MLNQAMQRKLNSREALDISGCPREGQYYVLPYSALDITDNEYDYCDAKTESWVWSIGLRKSDSKILASMAPEFYGNPDYECLWVR